MEKPRTAMTDRGRSEAVAGRCPAPEGEEGGNEVASGGVSVGRPLHLLARGVDGRLSRQNSPAQALKARWLFAPQVRFQPVGVIRAELLDLARGS